LLALIDGISENVFLENEFELSEWLDSHYLMLMRKYTQKAAEGLGILAAILLAA
jgi:hypothetical protein